MNWALFQNSLVVGAGSSALATVGGLCLAMFAVTLQPQARRIILALAVVSFALPPFLVTNTWLTYFGLAGTLRGYVPFELYSLQGTILLIALQLWPIPFFFILQGFLKIDRAYLEWDPLLTGFALIKHLIWPSVRPGFWQGAAISFVLALNHFSIPALLQTKVYAAEVWLSFSTRFDYFEAWLLSAPLILAPLALMVVLRHRATRWIFRNEHFAPQLFRERLGSIRHVVALLSGVLIFLSVLLPLGQLLFSRRTWAEIAPAVAAGQGATWNSLLFAFGSAVLVMICAIGLQRTRLPAALWLVFLAPGVLLGIAFIWIFNRPILGAFYGSAGIVPLAYLCRFLAVGWSGVRVATASVDPAPVEIVRVLGGSRWDQFRLSVWPQTRHLIMATSLLIYLMCLWEVETLILIVPPGRETLALRIFNMLHYGHAGQVNALCVWLLALALAPLVLTLIGKKLLRFGLPLLLLVTAGCGAAKTGTKIESSLFNAVEVIGSRGTGAGQFNKPRALAVDREDNLYVVDLTGRVQKFSPTGQFLLSWQMPQTDKGKPKGMIQDKDGNVMVIEPHYSRVNHFDPAGHLLAQWGHHGTNRGELMFPRAAAVNSQGEIFLSEYGQVERVLQFTSNGETCLNVIGSAGIGPGEFNRPEGLGVDPDDHLYVADSCNHRVQIFSAEGALIKMFGSAGSGPGQMSYPYDVRVDGSGLKFVCEFGNSRVQIFDRENRPLGVLGGPGGDVGQMNNPWSIALDSRANLYVADSGNHRVQKFIRRDPVRWVHSQTTTSNPPR